MSASPLGTLAPRSATGFSHCAPAISPLVQGPPPSVAPVREKIHSGRRMARWSCIPGQICDRQPAPQSVLRGATERYVGHGEVMKSVALERGRGAILAVGRVLSASIGTSADNESSLLECPVMAACTGSWPMVWRGAVWRGWQEGLTYRSCSRASTRRNRISRLRSRCLPRTRGDGIRRRSRGCGQRVCRPVRRTGPPGRGPCTEAASARLWRRPPDGHRVCAWGIGGHARRRRDLRDRCARTHAGADHVG